MAELVQINAARAQRRIEATAILDRFDADRDIDRLLGDFEKWCRLPGYGGFNGPNGQMFLKQVGRAAAPDEAATLLVEVLSPPTDESDARRRIARLVEFVESVRKGAHPAPARSPFLCSFFWALRSEESWPVAWPSATKSLVRLGWTTPTGVYAADYLEYRSVLQSLGPARQDVEHALYWFDRHPFVGLDPSIIDRVRRVVELNEAKVDDEYSSPEDAESARASTSAILGELRSLGDAAREHVEVALQRPVAVQLPGPKYNANTWRSDGWVRWGVTRIGGTPTVSIRVLATTEGVHVGLSPGWFRNGFYGETRLALEGLAPPGFEFRPVWWGSSLDASAVVAAESAHEWLLSKPVGPGDWSTDRMIDVVETAASTLRPLVEVLIDLAAGSPAPPEPGPLVSADPAIGDLVTIFLKEEGYPTPADEEQTIRRKNMAAQLAHEELPRGRRH